MGREMAKHDIPYVNLPAQGREQLEDLHRIFETVLLRGSFVGTDDELAALEKRIAEYCGAAEAVALNSGTDALMLAMLVAGVGRGDEVITPPNSFVASTAAIVHIGATYRGRVSGSFGHFGCFSAHPLKNLNALGDGGFVTTSDQAAAVRMRRLRAHGMADRQTVEEWGLVSRMDTLQAAILDYRLDKLPDVIAKRRANAALYQGLLRHEKIYVPPCRNEEFNTFHTFVVQVDRRDELQKYLRERGIKTAIHYPIPIHLQPAARGLGHKNGDFPMTERQAGRILTLPVNHYMSPADVEAVAGEVMAFLQR